MDRFLHIAVPCVPILKHILEEVEVDSLSYQFAGVHKLM